MSNQLIINSAVGIIVNGTSVATSYAVGNSGPFTINVTNGRVDISTPSSQPTIFTTQQPITISSSTDLGTTPVTTFDFHIGSAQTHVALPQSVSVPNALSGPIHSKPCTCVPGARCQSHRLAASERRRKRRAAKLKRTTSVTKAKKNPHTKSTKASSRKTKRPAENVEGFDRVLHAIKREMLSNTIEQEPPSNVYEPYSNNEQTVVPRPTETYQPQHRANLPEYMIGLPSQIPGEGDWPTNNFPQTHCQVEVKQESNTTTSDTSTISSLPDRHGSYDMGPFHAPPGQIMEGSSWFTSSGR